MLYVVNDNNIIQMSTINGFITPLKNPARRAGGTKPGLIFEGGLKENCKKKFIIHNGSENSENKKKYGVAEKLAKK